MRVTSFLRVCSVAPQNVNILNMFIIRSARQDTDQILCDGSKNRLESPKYVLHIICILTLHSHNINVAKVALESHNERL